MKLMLPLLMVWMATCFQASYQVEVVHAVNCGGPAFTDTNGINYQGDTTTQGSYNSWGQIMGGINNHDRFIYQSHRWDHNVLTYDVPLAGDGWYGLMLHLSDDSSPSLHRRRIKVKMNNEITLLGDLDFYRDCGLYLVCNRIFYFKVCGNRLHFDGQTLTLWDKSKVMLHFEALAVNVVIEGILLVKGKSGEGMPIVDTKTVFYFEPKKEVLCPGEAGDKEKPMCPPCKEVIIHNYE